ncbi:unnamed protein product [Cylindrotheca closterium]|uniref:Uncharacterized protein n=1 Tax=Cylindrotheca closterium TaxID=2856 RepID=A0AAD2GBA2_9STRA|nr:unnamed protein product [Cylindrotheca closterium]
MSPSGEKQLPLEPSTERILRQALNVVSTQSSSYSGSDVNLKKIAKKRRGAGGAVDVEYTKSSKEYLQKAQQSLRQESGSKTSSEFSSNSNATNESSATPPTDQSSSNPYGYEDPDAAPRKFSGPAHRSFSQPAISSAGNQYGYGDPAASNPYGYGDAVPSKIGDPAACNPYGYGDAAPSNPYGYENPDAAPTIRRRGPARRRGSVTKFSIQAAAAATAVTDRILQKTNLLSKKNCDDGQNKPMRRSTCAHVPSSDGRFNRMSMDTGKLNDSPPTLVDGPSSGDMKPTTPKRQASFSDPLEKAKQALNESTESIGKPNKSFGNVAVDVYENSRFTVAAPQRPRPRRRGPAFSISTEPEQERQDQSNSTLQSPVQSSLSVQKTPASSLGPEMETSLNDIQGLESRWSLIVPDQSLGRTVPQRSSSNHSFLSPKRSGSLRSLSRAAANLRKEKGESSMHDSIGSIASWDDNSFQTPQASKYIQSPNWRRKYSRSNSVGSIGSECDSLASDMESLCSISVRTDDRPGLPSPAASFKKCVVNRTPSKLSRHNSNGSLFGSRPKDNSNDDGSVSALKAMNLENTSKQPFGVARAANPNAVCRSYSGDRLRVLRDQKVVREQH